MIKEIEIAIVNSANRALKIMKKAPHLQVEEIIKKLLPFFEAEGMSEEAKIAAVAAINGVINLRRVHRELGDREIIERFMREYKKTFNDLK
jgi:hypothetical protein